MGLLDRAEFVIFHISEMTFPAVYANNRGPWIVKYADDTLDQLDNWLAFATREDAEAAIAAMTRAHETPTIMG